MTSATAGRWHFEDRWYTITPASDVSTRDGTGLELDDVGPAPERRTVVEAFYDDGSRRMTFAAFVNDPPNQPPAPGGAPARAAFGWNDNTAAVGDGSASPASASTP